MSIISTKLAAMALLAVALASASPLERIVNRGSYSGKMTWIGPTTGAYTACGPMYESGNMYVAVNPSLLTCSTTGMPMTITCNGTTVNAFAIDKCMGCDVDHIDVDQDVYEKCGFSTTDGGMQDSGISWSF